MTTGKTLLDRKLELLEKEYNNKANALKLDFFTKITEHKQKVYKHIDIFNNRIDQDIKRGNAVSTYYCNDDILYDMITYYRNQGYTTSISNSSTKYNYSLNVYLI